MTEEQRNALIRKIRDLLGEHCISYACVFELELPEGEASDDQSTVVAHTWGGTFTQAIGLTARLSNSLNADDRWAGTERPDDDDGDDWKQRA